VGRGIIDAANAGVSRGFACSSSSGITPQRAWRFTAAKVEGSCKFPTLLLEQEASVGSACFVHDDTKTPHKKQKKKKKQKQKKLASAFETAKKVGFRSFRVAGTFKRADRSVAIAALAKRPKERHAVVCQHQAGGAQLNSWVLRKRLLLHPATRVGRLLQTRKRPGNITRSGTRSLTHPPHRAGHCGRESSVGLQEKEEWHQSMMRIREL